MNDNIIGDIAFASSLIVYALRVSNEEERRALCEYALDVYTRAKYLAEKSKLPEDAQEMVSVREFETRFADAIAKYN